jgi:hypothetical protein
LYLLRVRACRTVSIRQRSRRVPSSIRHCTFFVANTVRLWLPRHARRVIRRLSALIWSSIFSSLCDSWQTLKGYRLVVVLHDGGYYGRHEKAFIYIETDMAIRESPRSCSTHSSTVRCSWPTRGNGLSRRNSVASLRTHLMMMMMICAPLVM